MEDYSSHSLEGNKIFVHLHPIINRGVAQLAARHVRDVEAGSSSLLTPTKEKQMKKFFHLLFIFSRNKVLQVKKKKKIFIRIENRISLL